MKKTLLPVVFALLIFASCKDTEEPVIMACGVSDPIKNLTWLSERVAEIEAEDDTDSAYVIMATYEGETVFSIGYCCATCLSVYQPYYNCEGVIVEGQAISSNLENREVIWKSENSTCEF